MLSTILIPKSLVEMPVKSSVEVMVKEEEKPCYNVPLNKELQAVVHNRCAEFGLDEGMVYAVIKTESEFKNVVKNDDYGLMQINEINHDALLSAVGKSDVMDEETNILMGTYLLRQLYQHWTERGLSGEELRVAVLSSYNRGISGYEENGVARGYVSKIYRNWREITDANTN